MKQCDPNDLLFSYVCGELSEEEVRLVDERCAADPAYARELALTRAAMRLLAHHKPIEPRPFFWTRLAVRLDAEEAPWQAWIWVAKRLIPSMVAATLIITAVVWYRTPTLEYSSFETELLASGETDEEYWLMKSQDISKETILQSAVFDEATRQE